MPTAQERAVGTIDHHWSQLMKTITASSIAVLSFLAAATCTSAATREEFRGTWSRDCGNGKTCHIEIDDMTSSKTLNITFSIEGNGETCSWSVDAIYEKDTGGPVAHDPFGNYFFYLTIQEDRQLYSSGTMLPICGPQPLDQYFTSDAQALIDNREIFDHNGSAMVVNPAAGSIVYRDPKKSIAGTIKPGTLLFRANAPWDPYDDKVVVKGIAYVFKKGCKPAPYEVSGRQEGWHTLLLKGAAPVRAKNGCNVVGYKMNGNSTLKFVSWGD